MTVEFGQVIIHTYKPGERQYWLRFERIVLEMLRWQYDKNNHEFTRALSAVQDRIKSMMKQDKESRKAKYQFHADNAARIFLKELEDVSRTH